MLVLRFVTLCAYVHADSSVQIWLEKELYYFDYTKCSIFAALLFCLLRGFPSPHALTVACFSLLYLDSSVSADVSCSQCRCDANLTEPGRYARSCSSHWTLHKKPHVWQPHIFFFLLFFKKWRNKPCTYIY